MCISASSEKSYRNVIPNLQFGKWEKSTWALWNIPHSNRCGRTVWGTQLMIVFMIDIHCEHPSSNGNILIAEHPKTVICIIKLGKKITFKIIRIRAWVMRICLNKPQAFAHRGRKKKDWEFAKNYYFKYEIKWVKKLKGLNLPITTNGL